MGEYEALHSRFLTKDVLALKSFEPLIQISKSMFSFPGQKKLVVKMKFLIPKNLAI